MQPTKQPSPDPSLDTLLAVITLVFYGIFLWACWEQNILFSSVLAFFTCVIGGFFGAAFITIILLGLYEIVMWKNGLGGILLGLGISWLVNRKNKDS